MSAVSTQHKAQPLAWQDVTDWFIPEDAAHGAIVYPGAVQADGELEEHVHQLRHLAVWRTSQDATQSPDWKLEYKGQHMRAHRQTTVDGTLYILRRISTERPVLAQLGLPKEVERLLVMPNFADQGGLVLVTGGPGQGKSTTCAAILVERVRTYGYFCLTVEDPPEFNLQGEYPSRIGRIGQIIQVPARTESFAYDLKDALRCYPSNMKGSMLMVGEVRDGNAAAQLLRTAVNGQLVFATLHAGDPIAALERIVSLAKEEMGADEAKSLLSHSLRGVLHQRLVQGRLEMDVLMSLSATSSVAARIKGASLAQLSSDRESQKTLLRNGKLVDSLTASAKLGG